MKTLLVAVDNSPTARGVVALAVQEAQAHQAAVVVVCCVDASQTLTSTYEIDAGEGRNEAGQTLDEQNTAEAVVRLALSELQRDGVNARGRVVAGEAAQTIVAQGRELNAAMIIMGRRHLSSFNRLLKGSCSATVIEQASCPVLVYVRAH